MKGQVAQALVHYSFHIYMHSLLKMHCFSRNKVALKADTRATQYDEPLLTRRIHLSLRAGKTGLFY